MATSPSTAAFFSSTTVPVYAPTAVFPPPPICFGAKPGASYTFSPTAYPPPVLPGGYYPSPYAATYPYPTPVSPAEAPGFSPVQECDSSTAAIHSSVAPPSVPQRHTSSTPRDGNSTTLRDIPVYQINRNSSAVHSASDNHNSFGSSSTASEFKTSTRRPQGTSPPSPTRKASSLLELPDLAPLFELPAYGSALTEMEPVVIASTAQQNKQDTSSAASSPGSFSGATSGSSASSTIPAPTPLFGFRSSSVSTVTSTTSSRCSSDSSKHPSSATASVAPQMFGEMPTPLSEYENYCCGNPNAIQSSCVGTLYEQNLGPVFDCYDDDMDGCSTEFFDVFLGTPEQQKSDQSANCFREAYLNAFSEDTPEQVSHAYDVDTKSHSDESVHVFASPLEQQPYEAKQQDSEHLLKCIGKAPENGQTIASLNYISDIFDFTLELQQADEEKANNCSVLKASDSFVPRSSHVSIECSRREVWDPGASALLHSANSKSHEELGYVAMLVPKALNLCNKVGTCVQQCVTHESEKEWDPGEQTILSSILSRDIVSAQYDTTHVLLVYSASSRESTENRLTGQKITANASSKVPAPTWHCSLLGAPFILLSNATYTWDPGVPEMLHSYTANHPIGTRPGIFTHVLQPIFASAISCSYAFALGWTEVNVQHLRDPSLKLLVTHESRKEYAYTVGFLNGQCKYIHQRGVQENHNAKQLLISSKNCLHIWKVDILFTTFLPP